MEIPMKQTNKKKAKEKLEKDAYKEIRDEKCVMLSQMSTDSF